MNTPNKITLARILMVPLLLIFIIPIPEYMLNIDIISSFNNILLAHGDMIATLIFIVAASTDGVDGYLARKNNIVTKLGIFLDPLADKLLVSSALIVLVQKGRISSWIAIIIIAREFIVTGFRLVAAGENIVISANKLGKIKTVLQIVSIAVALLNNYPFNLLTQMPIYQILMLITVGITIYSGWVYIKDNLHVLK